jgi:DNA polymerase-3 subunit delta'
VGHAYLFTGPEKVGKTTLARLFAQALNCEHPDETARPCQQCRPCRLIAGDRHPDVRLLEPELSSRGKRTLKIEAIRLLQQDLSLAAYEARYKVALLPHFEAATPGAANAFLKTLEEPAENVLLLLTAVDADSLLPTIPSRCRVVSLRPVPSKTIAAALETRQGCTAAEARRLAHLADGRPGWAFVVAQKPECLEQRDAELALLEEIVRGRRVDRFDHADRLARDAETLPALLRTWLSWWRDLTLLAYAGADASLVNVDHEETLRVLARDWEQRDLIHALEQTRSALWQLAHNANTRLVLENLFLNYPRDTRALPIR